MFPFETHHQKFNGKYLSLYLYEILVSPQLSFKRQETKKIRKAGRWVSKFLFVSNHFEDLSPTYLFAVPFFPFLYQTQTVLLLHIPTTSDHFYLFYIDLSSYRRHRTGKNVWSYFVDLTNQFPIRSYQCLCIFKTLFINMYTSIMYQN